MAVHFLIKKTKQPVWIYKLLWIMRGVLVGGTQ